MNKIIYQSDSLRIHKVFSEDDLVAAGESFINCLTDPEFHVGLLCVFLIYHRPKGKTKWKRWVCCDFLHDEIKGVANRELDHKEELEVWHIFRTIISPIEPEYTFLYTCASDSDVDDIWF